MVFRFRTKEEAEETIDNLGFSASPAILREINEYKRLKEKYPFRGRRHGAKRSPKTDEVRTAAESLR